MNSSNGKSGINIFKYDNYRSYLKDFYAHQKQVQPGFSYRNFARRAGLNAVNYLKQVIDGNRSVTDKNLHQFIKGLGLRGNEARYFTAMVQLERTTSLDEKQKMLDQMRLLCQSQLKTELEQEHYELFSNWYAWVVRELVCLSDFKPTAEFISKKLKNRITPGEAKECFESLQRLGFIVEENGTWKQRTPLITTSDEVASLPVRKVHQEMLGLGIESIIHDPLHEREASGLTLAISKEKIPALKNKIKEFRKELNLLFTNGGEADEVIQINVLAFKLTGGHS